MSKAKNEASIINGRYKLTKRIGSGGFGTVFQCKDITSGKLMAVKVEEHSWEREESLSQEVNIYIILKGAAGFPRLRWYGKQNMVLGDSNHGSYHTYPLPYYIIIMDMLGPSLDDVLEYCGMKFSVKTVLMIAEQLITRIEYLHEKGYIHRDLKPNNIVMGTGRNSNTLYIVDFGLCRPYLRRKNKHVSMVEGRGVTGTARYASLNAHAGYSLSRRDDMECLAYSFLYLLRGSLPWQNFKGECKREKKEYIFEKKTSISPEELFKGFPVEFVTFLKYCRGLKFDEKPDYQYVRQLFRNLFYASNYHYDNVFDWNIKPNPEKRSGPSSSKSKSSMKDEEVAAENVKKSKEEDQKPVELANPVKEQGEKDQNSAKNSPKAVDNSPKPTDHDHNLENGLKPTGHSHDSQKDAGNRQESVDNNMNNF